MSRIGSDVMLLVDVTGELEVIATQRDATFTENTAAIDVSSKDGRSQRVLAGRYSAEITMDSLYVYDDDAYEALVEANRTGELVMVARLQDGMVFGIGEGVVTSISDRFPDAAESTVSATVVVDQMLDTSTTNLVTNPSFETNTTGWATGGGNDITRDNAEARFGSWALECDYQDNATLASFAITLTEERHTLSVDIFIPASYDGASIQVFFAGFAGDSDNIVGDANMAIRDRWQRVFAFTTPDGADLSGTVNVENIGAAPTAGEVIYIDGVQVEALPYATPYCDGDQGPGHEWTGAAHASTSTRI